VVHGIVRKLVKNFTQCLCIHPASNLACQPIQQLNQLSMLLVDLRNAGVEVVIPRKDINCVHGLTYWPAINAVVIAILLSNYCRANEWRQPMSELSCPGADDRQRQVPLASSYI
jgi:hypothetical protein